MDKSADRQISKWEALRRVCRRSNQSSQERYTEPLDVDALRVYPSSEFPRDRDGGLLFQNAPWSWPHMHSPGYTEQAKQERTGYSAAQFDKRRGPYYNRVNR